MKSGKNRGNYQQNRMAKPYWGIHMKNVSETLVKNMSLWQGFIDTKEFPKIY